MQKENLVAVVTGASGGIGFELARLLAGDGYNLVLVARREDELRKIAGDFEQEFGVKVLVVAVDLAPAGSCEKVFEAVGEAASLRSAGVDVLVNNAGFGDYGFFVEADWEKTRAMMELNCVALTHLTQLFLPGMKKRGKGRILNVASTAAFQPGPLMAVYFATKAYVLSFSEAIASELEGSGVTVTALCPGPTESGFQVAAAMENSKLFQGRKRPSAAEVAAFGYTKMLRGKRVAIHGMQNRFLVFLVRFLPRTFVARMVRRVQNSL